jgi:putative hydrolase of the HAD superfamily
MDRDFDAVAFDLDGTLYPAASLNLRIVPFLLKHWRLVAAFGRAREQIRHEQEQSSLYHDDFYRYQAQLTAKRLKASPDEVYQRLDRLVYRGWEPLFSQIRLFPYVKELLGELKEKEFKLGLLSDFPPEAKLRYLGLGEGWDAVLCSEATGAIKPALRPFSCLADALGCAPGRILYVGNSYRYDVVGAKRAGMKTALITGFLRGRRKGGDIDVLFQNYRQLHDFVIE